MPTPNLHLNPKFESLAREFNLTADTMFTHPKIKPWRVLSDRENCLAEFTSMNGDSIRWHVKRYPASNAGTAKREVKGLELLHKANIPTMELVAWGNDSQGRTFVITNDLEGFQDSEKLVRNGLSFLDVEESTAQLAARLHSAGLHHRDLYLCHFFSKVRPSRTEVKLIDVARVRKMPIFLRRRWIIKDLAQFVYSMWQAGADEYKYLWLRTYCAARGRKLTWLLQWQVERKVRWIAKHDAALRVMQPNRNISINT